MSIRSRFRIYTIARRVHLAFATARRQPAAEEYDDLCAGGRLKTGVKTKGNMSAGMVFRRTNEAAGVFLNLFNTRALHRRC